MNIPEVEIPNRAEYLRPLNDQDIDQIGATMIQYFRRAPDQSNKTVFVLMINGQRVNLKHGKPYYVRKPQLITAFAREISYLWNTPAYLVNYFEQTGRRIPGEARPHVQQVPALYQILGDNYTMRRKNARKLAEELLKRGYIRIEEIPLNSIV